MSCFIAVSIQSETSCFLTMCARIVTFAGLAAAGAAALGASVGLRLPVRPRPAWAQRGWMLELSTPPL